MGKAGNQQFSLHSWEECYKTQRKFLLSYAFRMTGSLQDAEDIVQDTIADCLAHDFDKVANHRAWMTKICSHKALDLVKSAAKKRNDYIGTWLPDLIPDTIGHILFALSEEQTVESSESLTTSFLILLQTLTPIERAVFLLKDIFDYSFNAIAQLTGKSVPACRKIAQRARASVDKKKDTFARPPVGSEKLIRAFFHAIQMGNQALLEELLTDKSEFLSEGGGNVPAAAALAKKEQIVHFFMALHTSSLFSQEKYRWQVAWVNERPGVIISKLLNDSDWQVETLMSFDIENAQIMRLFAQRNPLKLVPINAHLFPS